MCKDAHTVWTLMAITNHSTQSIIFEGSRLQKCGHVGTSIPACTSTSPLDDLWEKNPERCHVAPFIAFASMCDDVIDDIMDICDIIIQDGDRMLHQVGHPS